MAIRAVDVNSIAKAIAQPGERRLRRRLQRLLIKHHRVRDSDGVTGRLG